MHYPKKIEKEVGDNDRIFYFDGKLDDINVFVKRILIKRGDLKDNVECANIEFSRLERVVKLFPFESDEKFNYFAFEKMNMDLATYIKEQNKKTFIDEEERRKLRLHIIRGIVKALKEIHSNHTFHNNFALEHMLLIFFDSDDVAIKLRGLGSSRIYSKKQFCSDRYLDTENLRLGRTLWNYLTVEQHNFKEDDLAPGFEVGPITNPNFQGLDLVAAYLIK
ncbi:glutamine--tRNA ligase [Tanacetum coccineum]